MLRNSTRRRRKEDGAALLESAIVILPLMVILFGIVEFGFVFKDSLTLSNASRAGARIASAEPTMSSFYEDTMAATSRAAGAGSFQPGDEIFIYRARDDGRPESGSHDVCSSNCVRYTWTGSDWTQNGGGGWPPNNHQACFGEEMDDVGVSVQLTHTSITNFFPFINNMSLREHTVMRFEPLEDCF